ncbi:MAG TPA: alpha/beta hydrolase [Thermoanaerobaculia bacterium]
MRALRIAAILLVALFLFAQYVRRTGMFFPSRYPTGNWDAHAYAVAPEDVAFAAPDGVTLHGWLFRANGRASPLLVWFHGNGGNVTDRAPVAAELARRGIACLVFDWRGYGKSGGRPSEGKLKLDALAAYDFAAAHAKPDDIVLYGESLGGPFAAYVATERKARCVVIENSFPSLMKLGNALYRPLPLGWFAPLALRTTAWLNAARLPVLVMHGKRDQVIPFALGKELYDGLDVPKQMFVCETAGHCEIPAVEGARYYEAVAGFVTGTSRRRSYR